MALWPIHKKYKIKRAIISTYQAASGAGSPGMLELLDGINSVASGNKVKNQYFAHPLAYNIIPHIDSFQDNSYTKEEMKIAWESKKIMNAPEIKVSCTCVRIPTMRAHAESITIETEEVINANDVRDLLKFRECPAILVTHNTAEAELFSDRIINLLDSAN